VATLACFHDSRKSVRVLVVEDFAPFRRFLCATLKKEQDLQIIGEVSDGDQAVQKARELKPDLVLLDIRLPNLDGLAVARQIRSLSPKSKIIFVTQESSADVVQEALGIGALGYVVKTRVATDLSLALAALRTGRPFVSRGLSGHGFSAPTDTLRRKSLTPADSPVAATGNGEGARSHKVQFFSDDESFLVGFTRFIAGALRAGSAVVVVATESHRSSLFQRLQAQGLNIGASIEQGRYIPLDVADTLSTFMVDDLPDSVRFRKIASDLVAGAAKAALGKSPRVAACGECAPFLWARGNADAAIRVEHLWDEMAKAFDLDILCGYALTKFQREQEGHVYERICAVHTAVSSQ
jgi:DNA-binding NarL/FixJ family response regulator